MTSAAAATTPAALATVLAFAAALARLRWLPGWLAHQAAGDWARQYDLAMDTIRWALEQAGASVEDVVRRRTFTVEGARQNRPYGEGPTPFVKSHPTSLGCRISGLARPELVVEVEVTAVKGAGAGIQWIGPDATDPLDAS